MVNRPFVPWRTRFYGPFEEFGPQIRADIINRIKLAPDNPTCKGEPGPGAAHRTVCPEFHFAPTQKGGLTSGQQREAGIGPVLLNAFHQR